MDILKKGFDSLNPKEERLIKGHKKESMAIKMLKEKFPNISFFDKKWKDVFLSPADKMKWKSLPMEDKYLTEYHMTDFYSPTLKAFFDYKSDFTYLKLKQLIGYVRQIDLFPHLGNEVYYLWWEVKYDEGYVSRPHIQWYVINAENLYDDLIGKFELEPFESDWIYNFNQPTNDFGVWDDEWIHIGHSQEDESHIVRILQRHRQKFEDVFFIDK